MALELDICCPRDDVFFDWCYGPKTIPHFRLISMAMIFIAKNLIAMYPLEKGFHRKMASPGVFCPLV